MCSILYKIKAIDEITHSEGRFTPGVDNVCFKAELRKAKSEEDALKILESKIIKAKHIISIAKGKTDQSIARKGINHLSEREKYRRYLKSEKGKNIVEKQREVLKEIKKDPLSYIEKEREKVIKHNSKLRFLCLKEV